LVAVSDTQFRPYLVALLALLLVVPVLALLVIEIEGPRVRGEAVAEINAIGQLKAAQIEAWLAQRQDDAEMLMARDRFIDDVERWLATGDASAKARLDRRRASLRRAFYQWEFIDAGKPPDDPERRALMADVLESGKPRMSRLYRDTGGMVWLEHFVPLYKLATGAPVAVAVLRTAANQFLFPLVQSWPTPSGTAETLLFQRDGDSVLYLSESRHQKNTALLLRKPLNAPDLPAAQAIRDGGGAQTIQGVDYRGVEVLTAIRAIQDSPWHLVAKIDLAEVMRPLYTVVTWVTAVSTVAVGALVIFLLLLRRQNLRSHRLEMLAQTGERDRLLALFYELPFMGMAIVDPASDRWRQFNDRFCEILGYSREELLAGITWEQLTHPEDLAADLAEYHRMLAGEIDSYHLEKRFLRKDGSAIEVGVSVKCVRRPDGSVEHVVMTIRDISVRKQLEAAQEERRRANRLLHAMAAASTDAIFAKDLEGRYIFYNQAAARALGRQPEEVLGQDDSQLFPAEQAARIKAVDQEIISLGQSMTYEEALSNLDGERIFLTTKGPLEDGAGRVIGVYGIACDITGRKFVEEQLRRSKEQMHLFIEHAPLSIAMFDLDLNYLSCSRRWLEDYGQGCASLTGQNLYAIHSDLPEAWRAMHQRGLAGETLNSEADHWIRQDGSEVWLRWALVPWWDVTGRIGGIIISTEDISDLMRSRKQLARSNARLAGIIDSAMDAIITLDERQRVLTFNPAAEQMFGYSAAEMLDQTIERLIPLAQRAGHGESMQAFAEAGTTSRGMGALGELHALRSDGAEFPIEASISKTTLADEQLLTVILRDISQRRASEQALRVSEERFRSLVEQAADGIFVADAQGHYLDVNTSACAMLGYSRAELLGLNIADVIDPAEVPRIGPEVARFADGAVALSEWRFKRRDGSLFSGEISGRQLADGRLQAILRDISQRKETEDALRYQLDLIRGITEKSTDSIFICDPDGRVTAMNPEAERVFGYRLAELRGQPLHAALHHHHPDGRPFPVSECPLCRVYDNGATIRDHEAIFFRRDGGAVTVTCSNAAIEVGGQRLGATLVLHDITAIKQTERALIERDADLNRAQMVGHIGSWRLDMRADVLTWSQENYRIFGIAEGTPITYARFLDCVHPDERDHVDREWQAALRGAPYDIIHRIVVDGEVKWVREKAELEFDAEGRLVGGFGTTQDISEMKAAERALDAARNAAIEEKTLLETIMQTLPVGVAIVDSQGGSVRYNTDYERIWGGPGPAVNTVADYTAFKAWWLDSGRPVEPQEWASALTLQSGRLVANQLMQIQRFDGSFAYVLNSAAPIRDLNGDMVGAAVVIQDITESKQVEHALRVSEERFQLAAEIGRSGTWDWDVASGEVIWSRGHYDLLGYQVGEVVPSFQAWLQRLHPDDRARIEAESTHRCTSTATTCRVPARLAGWFAALDECPRAL
jgi:PAS domain S-box-containing protein